MKEFDEEDGERALPSGMLLDAVTPHIIRIMVDKGHKDLDRRSAHDGVLARDGPAERDLDDAQESAIRERAKEGRAEGQL